MRRKIIPYDRHLKQLARNLRNDSTLGEILLWQELKNKQLMGFDFHRQKPLLKYIVDFYCAELNLIIEIDGGSHENAEQQQYDLNREAALKTYNLKIIRFTEQEVRKDMGNALRTLLSYVEKHSPNLSEQVNPDDK
ncbi:MAG: endonuclease domain-containing protein [Sphingobacteriaceae bacterium]